MTTACYGHTCRGFAVLAAMLVCAITGCGPSDEQLLAVFDPYADNAKDHVDDFVEVDIGRVFVSYENGRSLRTVLTAQLFAIVPTRKQGEIEYALTQKGLRLRGRLREIIQAVDVSALNRNNLQLLKADLVKAVRRELRTDSVKEIVFAELETQ